jgi:hypothetical protein
MRETTHVVCTFKNVVAALGVAVASLGGWAASGCGGDESASPPPPPALVAAPQGAGVAPPGAVVGGAGQVPPGADAAALADRQLGDKLGPIIRDCLNRFDAAVGRSRGRYLQWVESEERGPTGRERNVYGLYEIGGNLAGCQTAIQTSNAAPPAIAELHAATTAYGAALTEVAAKVAEAYTYYERENYRDDGFERGRALHPGLMAAFNAFRAASRELDDRVNTANRGVTERRIARLANDPRRAVQVMVERHLLLAEDTLKLVHEWGVEDRRLTGVDADAMLAQVTQLETLTDQLAAALAAGQGAGTVASTSEHWLTSYAGDAAELLTQAKGVMRRVRDGETFSRGELMNLGGAGAWMVDGAPPRMVREYNEMIDQYNRIRWVQ